MGLSTKQKEKVLNGKRYKIISESIEKSRTKGEDIPYEMEIDLHHSWHLTITGLKNGLKNGKS